MHIFLMCLGEVNLKVHSAFLCVSLSAFSCPSSAVPGRAQLGKSNRQGKEQLGPAPTHQESFLCWSIICSSNQRKETSSLSHSINRNY